MARQHCTSTANRPLKQLHNFLQQLYCSLHRKKQSKKFDRLTTNLSLSLKRMRRCKNTGIQVFVKEDRKQKPFFFANIKKNLRLEETTSNFRGLLKNLNYYRGIQVKFSTVDQNFKIAWNAISPNLNFLRLIVITILQFKFITFLLRHFSVAI